VELIEKGTAALEEGDLEEARKWYSQSVEVKSTTGGWYNLGVSDALCFAACFPGWLSGA
jgi:hypothetical protein